jgi:hypothetical protein
VAQTFVAEMLVAWHWQGFRRSIRACIRFGLILAVPIVALSVAVWFNVLTVELKDPVLALKHIWWQQTKGPVTGPGQVVITFLGYAFVSPDYSWLMLPEGINMRDFRAWSFVGLAGWVAAPLWLLFWAIGTGAALMHRGYRPTAAAIGVALCLNLLFHLKFQFRGSLYLYAAHPHFLVFALGAGVAPWLSFRSGTGKVYAGGVLLLALLLAINNVPIAHRFVTDFDEVYLACTPPCADQVGQ